MSTSPVETRFVLLSSARSGTSAFIGGIEQHDEVYSHREIFLENTQRTVREEFHKAYDVDALKKNPVEYVESILSFTPGPKCVGFKMWFGQSPEACQHLLSCKNTKKFILERKNRLAQYSSQKISKLAPVSHATNEERLRKFREGAQKATFDRQEFEKFVVRRDRLYKKYDKLAKGDVFKLAYTDIHDDIFGKVFRFLKLNPTEVNIRHLKLNSSDIVSRFREEDHDTIRRSLDKLGHPEWEKE